jgi:hypothetical protein
MPRDPSPKAHRDPAESVHRDLIREFGGSIPHGLLRTWAHEAVEELGDARVREFVDVFAWRRAREWARSSLAMDLAEAG